MIVRYAGHAFNESFQNGKSSGHITLSREGVHFRNDDTECLLPLNGLNVELGGASNRILFFDNPTVDGWRFYTSDQSILKDPVLENNVHLKGQVQKVKKTKSTALLFALLCMALLFLALAGVWLMKDSMVHAAAEKIPVEWETKLGDSAFDQFSAGHRILEDKDLNADLAELLKPLLAVASSERFDYKFHLIEDSTLNAAAFPGGNVIIHTGLILTLKSPEQLLGVLAHEMAHVNQQHSIRSLINSAGLYIVLDAFVGGIGAVSGVILNGGTQLLSLKNSREHERESDEIGWSYLVAAKIDPRGLIGSFEIMEESQGELMKENAALLDFVSTHPALKDRIAYLQEKWQETEDQDSYKAMKFDYNAFQKKVREQLNEDSESESSTKGSEQEEKDEN
jgi:beta-barrel assembly-enhancing protease